MKKFFVWIVILLMSSSLVHAATDKVVTGDELLARVKKTYATANTYSDSGTVKIVTTVGKKHVEETINFSIVFSKKSGIKVEWMRVPQHAHADNMHTNFLWSDGKKHLMFSAPSNRVRTEDSIKRAIARSTGVSGGAAHTIPSTLLNMDSQVLNNLTDISIEEGKAQTPQDCYRLTGRHVSGKQYTLFIDKTTSIIRQIESSQGMPGSPSAKISFIEKHMNILLNKEQAVDALSPPATPKE